MSVREEPEGRAPESLSHEVVLDVVDGVLMDWNPRATELLGLTERDRGRRLDDVINSGA